MSASCVICGLTVGCSCKLIGGKCAACRQREEEAKAKQNAQPHN